MNDLITKSECERTHDALIREQDNKSRELGNLWTSINLLRNHLPPWGAVYVSFSSVIIGVLATLIATR